MAWRPVLATADLPTVGVHEDEFVDFKRDGYAGSDAARKECACDIAAFANSLGGTIIVGADENPPGVLAQYVGIANTEDQIVRIRDVARQRIRPELPVDVRCVATDGGATVVVVNIEPSASVVGVDCSGDNWKFPKRYADRTRYLTFSEFEEMISQDRRAKLMLLQVPEHSRENITVNARREPSNVPTEVLEGWTLDTLADFHCELTTHRGEKAFVPYAFVDAVWPIGGGEFVISLCAYLTRRPEDGAVFCYR